MTAIPACMAVGVGILIQPRVGDIISHDHTSFPGEYQITRIVAPCSVGGVADDWEFLCRDARNIAVTFKRLDRIHLLRRPVEVGDVLVWPDCENNDGKRTVHSVSRGNVISTEQGFMFSWNNVLSWSSIKHENGMSLERPRPDAADKPVFTQKTNAARVKAITEEVHTKISEAYARKADPEKPVVPPPSSWQALMNRANQAETRASQLSDQCGTLQTEINKLKIDNSDWRRTAEDLERKLKQRK